MRDPDAEVWPTVSGVAGYVWRSASPRAVVLLQHGFGEHSRRYVSRYTRLIPNLVAHGLDVYAFDLPGHGQSRGARGRADLVAAVELHLRARERLAACSLPVFLLGHSLGGLVTAGSVVRDPDNLGGVVLSAPSLPQHPHVVRWVASLAALAAPGARAIPLPPRSGLTSLADEIEAFSSDPLVYQGPVPLAVACSALAVARSVWSRANRWSAPTLLIHGTADVYCDPAGTARLAAMIPAQDKTLRMEPDGRHELLNDVQGPELLRELTTWLNHRLPTAAPSGPVTPRSEPHG